MSGVGIRIIIVPSGTASLTIPIFLSWTVETGLGFALRNGLGLMVMIQSLVSKSVSVTLPWGQLVTQGQLVSVMDNEFLGTTVV